MTTKVTRVRKIGYMLNIRSKEDPCWVIGSLMWDTKKEARECLKNNPRYKLVEIWIDLPEDIQGRYFVKSTQG